MARRHCTPDLHEHTERASGDLVVASVLTHLPEPDWAKVWPGLAAAVAGPGATAADHPEQDAAADAAIGWLSDQGYSEAAVSGGPPAGEVTFMQSLIQIGYLLAANDIRTRRIEIPADACTGPIPGTGDTASGEFSERLRQPLPDPAGTRIALVSMPADPDPLKPGTFGTITGGNAAQVRVAWDNGRKLMLALPEDTYRVLGAGDCTCVHSCADNPRTACSLSGQFHIHAGGDPCPLHPDAPGDR